MSMETPRLAEHAYWIRRDYLKHAYAEHGIPTVQVPPPWDSLRDWEKEGWCEAVEEVLRRAGLSPAHN